MARIGKLTVKQVEAAKKSLGDGGGLWLQVKRGGKSWLFRYWDTQAGFSREMGLGSTTVVTLAEARDLAADLRRFRHQGINPLEARRETKKAKALSKAKAMTFEEATTAYIQAKRAGWRNEKHIAQWSATLKRYAFPVIGDLSVADVDTDLILKVIEPIWSNKTETATRVRGRVEKVLDWVTTRKIRTGDNPARWKGHLDSLLPKPGDVRAPTHFSALAYKELPDFLGDLQDRPGVGARALEFAILTALRTEAVIGAQWSEIDLAAKVWTVPGVRMKRRRKYLDINHKAPLSDRAVEVLNALSQEGDFVFPGDRAGKPISNMAMLKTLERMGRDDITVHGFRSTFKDWAMEKTNFPSIVSEMALGHLISDKVLAAYQRTDLFDKRRALMSTWADYCASTPVTDNVVEFPIAKEIPG